MTAVTLPDRPYPGPASVEWQVIDFGGTMQGPLGGSSQRVNRLGNRWRVQIALPAMTPANARRWSAALVRGLRLGVVWRVRQVGLMTGSPGTPLVNGGSQTGTQLDCDGFNPGYRVKAGTFFSLSVSSQRYLYQVAADAMADASGVLANLEVEPPLRASPADNAALEFAIPYVQGLLAEVPPFLLDVDQLSKGFAFAIAESR